MASTTSLDLNPRTNPLIDPLTLPPADIKDKDLEIVIRANQAKLGPIVDLYLGTQVWGPLKTTRYYVSTTWSGDARSRLMTNLPTELVALNHIRNLLRMKIIQQCVGEDANEWLEGLDENERSSHVISFIMLAPKDRTPEAFEQLKRVPSPSKSFIEVHIPRELRGICLRSLSSLQERYHRPIVDFVVYIYGKVDIEKCERLLQKLTQLLKEEKQFNFGLGYIFSLLGKIQPVETTEETLTHLFNLLGYLIMTDRTLSQTAELFEACDAKSRPLALKRTGIFLDSFTEDQRPKLYLSTRLTFFSFANSLIKLNTSERDFWNLMYLLKEKIIENEFKEPFLKSFARLFQGFPEALSYTECVDFINAWAPYAAGGQEKEKERVDKVVNAIIEKAGFTKEVLELLKNLK